MAGITLIFSALERNLVFSLGMDVQKDDKDDDGHEVVVVESSADTQIQRIGFSPNREEEEDDEDDSRYRSSGSVLGRTPGRGVH